MGSWVLGAGFRVQGSGFQGLGFRVYGVKFGALVKLLQDRGVHRVEDLGFKV